MDLITFWDDEMADSDSEDMLRIVSSSSSSETEECDHYNPLCFVRIISVKINCCRWATIKQEIILSFFKKTGLFIFFHSFCLSLEVRAKICPCILPGGTTTLIMINDRANVENSKKMSGLYIPAKSNLYIHPYYFRKTILTDQNCRVITVNSFDNNETIYEVRNMLFKLFDNKLTNVCLILLGDFIPLYNEMLEFTKSLKDLDQTRQIPVIGGTVNELLLCDPDKCRFVIDGVIIAIKSMFLKAWTLSLNASCNTEEQIRMEFVEFKNSVKLKKYSFCYMYYCRRRVQSLINLEKKLFKETFPKVELFTIYGPCGFAADDLNEIFPLTKQIQNFQKMVFTSELSHFMLITYN